MTSSNLQPSGVEHRREKPRVTSVDEGREDCEMEPGFCLSFEGVLSLKGGVSIMGDDVEGFLGVGGALGESKGMKVYFVVGDDDVNMFGDDDDDDDVAENERG